MFHWIIISIIAIGLLIATFFSDSINNDEIFPLQEAQKHGFVVENNKIVPLTVLTEEQMNIQRDKGCVACHEK